MKQPKCCKAQQMGKELSARHSAEVGGEAGQGLDGCYRSWVTALLDLNTMLSVDGNLMWRWLT